MNHGEIFKISTVPEPPGLADWLTWVKLFIWADLEVGIGVLYPQNCSKKVSTNCLCTVAQMCSRKNTHPHLRRFSDDVMSQFELTTINLFSVCPLNAKLAWFFQECPSFIVPLVLLSEVWSQANTTQRVLLIMLLIHYFQR